MTSLSFSSTKMRTHLSTLLTLLLSISLALASPHPSPSPASPSVPTATITPPTSYYLRSRVIGPNGNHSDKDGLYVSCYHTGNNSIPAPSSFTHSLISLISLTIFLFNY